MPAYQDFPPALLILSPRLTKSGDPAASIVGISTTPLPNGAIVFCIENKSTYQLDKSSVVPADGNLVLAPLTGPGRWTTSLGSTGWTLEGEWVPEFKCYPFTGVTPSGAGPTVQPFGTPTSTTPLDYQVLISTGGAPGTATFDLSDDGGATFFLTNQTVPVSTRYDVAGRGFSLFFAAGVYVLNDTYDFSTVFADLGNGTLVGNYRIVGDSAEIRLVFTPGNTTDFGGGVGTPTSQLVLLPLPPGYVIDADKLPVYFTLSPQTLKIIEGIATITPPIGQVGVFFVQIIFDDVVVGTRTTVLTAIPIGNPASLLATSVPLKKAP